MLDASDKEAARVAAELRQFEIDDRYDFDLAAEAARNFRILRNDGRTVRKTIDLLIATHCIRNHHALLHRDRDFDAFEERLGLMVIHPRLPPARLTS